MTTEEPIWEFISLKNYVRPTYIFEQSLKSRFTQLTRNLTGSKNKDVYLTDLEQLREISETKLNRLASEPDLSPAVEQLEKSLKDWSQSKTTKNDFVFVINPPRSYTKEILVNYGNKNKITIIKNPTCQDIFDQSFDIQKAFEKSSEKIFLIPNLEKFYLRHFKGLKIVRDLFFYLWNTEVKVIIGVNSWSWVYLQKVMEINLFGVQQLILKPLGYKLLESWFKSLKKDTKYRKIVFRKANDGHYVINPELDAQAKKPKSKIDNSLLKNLSAYSEGSPHIAWTIWRFSLRIEPDDEFFEKNIDEEDSKDSKKLLTTWVVPWERLKLPGRVDEVARSELLILHTLLIHDGLSEEWLESLLSLSKMEIILSIRVLFQSNLIKNENNEWKVTTVGYPYAKKLLSNYGFFTDSGLVNL